VSFTNSESSQVMISFMSSGAFFLIVSTTYQSKSEKSATVGFKEAFCFSSSM